MVEQLESQRTQKIFSPFLWGAKYRRNEAEKDSATENLPKLIIVKIIPFNVLDYLNLTEQTYAILLLDSILMGSILYALAYPLQKNHPKHSN